MKYQIADYLPERGRRLAVEAMADVVDHKECFRRGLFRGEEACPLGVVFVVEDWSPSTIPSADMAAMTIHSHHQSGDGVLIHELTDEFIRDWDRGAITDLVEAFGLEDTSDQETAASLVETIVSVPVPV